MNNYFLSKIRIFICRFSYI